MNGLSPSQLPWLTCEKVHKQSRHAEAVRVSERKALETLNTLPTIIEFEIPAISSWTVEAHRPVFARLNVIPPAEWNQAFDVELARADKIIRAAELQLSGDRIRFFALPTNIGSLRCEMRRLVSQINHRATKAIRKSQRNRRVEDTIDHDSEEDRASVTPALP